MNRIARSLWISTVFALGAGIPSLPHAQDYPTRPVRVIVPFSPGGAVDGPMRMIAQELGKRLGQQVVVENKPGAGATIGTDDGREGRARRLHAAARVADQRDQRDAVRASSPFDPIEDFAPISLIGREPGVLVVNPSLPVKTLRRSSSRT